MTDDSNRERSGAVNPPPLRGSVMNESKADDRLLVDLETLARSSDTGERWMGAIAVAASAEIKRLRAALRSSAPQGDGRALETCEYCGDGKRTGLPGNACENCMNTGLKYPSHDTRKALDDLLTAAKAMPRATPGPGGAMTAHSFTMEAWQVWDLDRAIIRLESVLALSAPPSVALEALEITDAMVESGLAAWMICEAGPTRRIVRTILEAALTRPQPGGAVAGTERVSEHNKFNPETEYPGSYGSHQPSQGE